MPVSLDPAQIAELERRVLATLEQLNGEIETLKTLVQPVAPDRAIGRLSRLEAMNEKSMNEAALRSAERRRARLGQRPQDDVALERDPRHVADPTGGDEKMEVHRQPRQPRMPASALNWCCLRMCAAIRLE